MKLKLVIFIVCFSQVVIANDTSWKKLYSKGKLKFYEQKSKSSSLLKFRAIGEIKIKTEEALAILRNVELTPKWEKNTIKKITIENLSDIQAITYSITNIPWPMTDRDMVLDNLLYINREKKYLYVISQSVKHNKYKKKNTEFIRAEIYVELRIRPKDDNWSYVDLIAKVDPKGSIPDWLVNLVQQDMPYEFLTSLEEYAKKVDLKPNPGVVKLYNELLGKIAVSNPGPFGLED